MSEGQNSGENKPKLSRQLTKNLTEEQKVVVLRRLAAKGVDLLIMGLAASLVIYPLGPVAGFLYSLFSDCISFHGVRGQSLGKRLLGFRVITEKGNQPISAKISFLRNLPVGFATFCAIIPVWGWIILILVGLPLLGVEIYMMLRNEEARRIGDLLAETRVVAVQD